tara:strand:- start:22 stop:216 length:195 start_codon:yes stop_codon:yes gene_type:complete
MFMTIRRIPLNKTSSARLTFRLYLNSLTNTKNIFILRAHDDVHGLLRLLLGQLEEIYDNKRETL